MSAVFQKVIENIESLSSDEKALVAHCLISSLEIKHDDSVDEAWAKLAKKRFNELESSAVNGISWRKLKASIK